ncbi:MAG: hypothetical protein HYW70_01970 [Candidatus Nealsonbacteria bacterium]|nr:hypothetical protein [Candidatus Nealsonbacteria bacterium]
MKQSASKYKAWVVGVDMGYGHQRTAYPLRQLASDGNIIHANHYQGIPSSDRTIWENKRRGYEFISRFKRIPLVGQLLFLVFNEYQKIKDFYPRRDLSRPNFAIKHEYSLIKKGWGKHLISELNKNPLPLITTFFIPAFMADHFNYRGQIFCVICDADVSRTWVSLNPKKSKINYFAPTTWVADRLKLYGVPEKNICQTGYPLPLENIGTKNMEILKDDLRRRILNLDPKRKYLSKYGSLVRDYLGELPKRSDHPLTIMFSVGGAGAQGQIGIRAIRSLIKEVKKGAVKINLVAGIRSGVREYFYKEIARLGLAHQVGKSIEIVFGETMESYFRIFNEKLRKTDILWTKPSELSFYCALGLPILIAPAIGYQEEFNKRWLLSVGSGIPQENPDYISEWLYDFLNGGRFAQSAMEGFIKAEKFGTFNIKKLACYG